MTSFDLLDLRPLHPWRLLALACGLAAAAPAVASPPTGLETERVVVLMRHGLRAPLPTEAAAQPRPGETWPAWQTPASQLTPRGHQALLLGGAYLRQWLQSARLLPAQGCPQVHSLHIWSNSVSRTIASGEAMAESLAPGCTVSVGHLPQGQTDPLFNPIEAGAVDFDAVQAVRQIEQETGGVAALVAPEGASLRAMRRALGCEVDRPEPRCTLQAGEAALRPGRDGRGLELRGPIDVASGTAQVFALQYAEGLPLANVAWGRAGPAELARMSRLHALLFDVYARPSYMAQRIAGPMSATLLGLLMADSGPAVSVFVGHDNNVAALTALLGVSFQLPGYGRNDPPVGGMLRLERLRDPKTGQRHLRLSYQAQSLQQIRDLQPLTPAAPPLLLPLALPEAACRPAAHGLCTLDEAAAWWRRRLYRAW